MVVLICLLAVVGSLPADVHQGYGVLFEDGGVAGNGSCEQSARQSAAANSYNFARIDAPADDTALRGNAGNVTVVGRVDPPLRCGHRVQLLLDGVPAAAPIDTPTFTLVNIDRGTHQLQLRIVDAADTVLFTGEPSTFYLLRHSRLHL